MWSRSCQIPSPSTSSDYEYESDEEEDFDLLPPGGVNETLTKKKYCQSFKLFNQVSTRHRTTHNMFDMLDMKQISTASRQKTLARNQIQSVTNTKHTSGV